jgi:hypothetical protein
MHVQQALQHQMAAQFAHGPQINQGPQFSAQYNNWDADNRNYYNNNGFNGNNQDNYPNDNVEGGTQQHVNRQVPQQLQQSQQQQQQQIMQQNANWNQPPFPYNLSLQNIPNIPNMMNMSLMNGMGLNELYNNFNNYGIPPFAQNIPEDDDDDISDENEQPDVDAMVLELFYKNKLQSRIVIDDSRITFNEVIREWYGPEAPDWKWKVFYRDQEVPCADEISLHIVGQPRAQIHVQRQTWKQYRREINEGHS